MSKDYESLVNNIVSLYQVWYNVHESESERSLCAPKSIWQKGEEK